MKVILNGNVAKLGYKGDVVEVKDGYFRNFLFPKNLAVVATKSRVELANKRREKVVLEKERLLENVKEVLGKIKGLVLQIPVRVTGKGTLYAALKEDEVIAAVRAASNVQLEKKHVKFEEALKTLGEHSVTIDFGGKNTVDITVNLVKEE
ncbi:MAG: 50S ribosomal protein L9 [Candidatus Gracilibacteria bacterium]